MDDETMRTLRNALGQHAHALPEQRKLHSPPNNAQFRILAEATLTPGQFSDDHSPVIRATAAPTRPFRPVKEITFVKVETAYGGSGLADKIELLHMETQDRAFGAMVHAIELAECIFDGVACFPPPSGTQDKIPAEHADCCDTCKAVRLGEGIPLSSFGNPLGCGISFPTCSREARLAFRIGPDFLTCLEAFAPSGYDKTPKSIRVAIYFNMIGPALR